jgi:hypothetical protein
MIEFRLASKVKMIGIDEPVLVNPDIKEPIKWSDIPLVGSVDKRFHGFLESYNEGDLKLDFTCDSGQQLLKDQYYAYGTDAYVQFFVVDVDRSGQEYIDFSGKIDYETIEILPGRVSVSIVTNDDHDKVNSRWETPIDLSSPISLDNVGFSVTPAIQIPLYGQTVHEIGEYKWTDRQTENANFSAGYDHGGTFYVLPGMTKQLPVSLTALPNALPALSTLSGVNTLAATIAPLSIQPPSLVDVSATTAGDYHLEVDWNFKVNVVLSKPTFSIGKPKFALLRFEPILIINKPGAAPQTIALAPAKSGDGYTNSVEHAFTVNYKGDFDWPVGTQAYLFCKIPAFTVQTISQIGLTLETSTIRVQVERKTSAESTRTQAYLLSDALKHIVGAITSNVIAGGTGAAYGSLIDAASGSQAFDGAATEYAITNGSLLRGMNKAGSFSMKDLMETLWALHRAGILYEANPVTGQRSLRIEEGAWFYRGEEIAVIEEVFEYSEDPDLDLLFNKITVGYAKYPDSGAGVTEEFNTVHTYQTPLVNRVATEEILCPLIGAGTQIEMARRLGITQLVNGVSQSSTDAGAYDDDGFIIHVRSTVHADTFTFIVNAPTAQKPYVSHYLKFSSNIITRLAGGVILKIGDKITISGTGTVNDGKTYTISAVSGLLFLSISPTYEVKPDVPMVAAGPIAGSWRVTGQTVQPRTNERLDVSGIADPATTYNLELSPARMLRRHAAWINSGLAYKKTTEVLRCTSYKQNGTMSTQAKSSASPLPGDPDKQFIKEVGDIPLGALARFEKLFSPELIKVQCRIPREVRREIFAAMTNRHTDPDKNLGYLTIRNPDKNLVSGYLREIRYNYSSEVADLILRKRKPIVDANGFTCNDYANMTVAELAQIDPQFYMFCLYSDFA